MRLKIKKISPRIGVDIPAPFYASPGSAAMDLHACIDGPLVLEPGGRALVPTGIAAELPDAGWAACVFARSGLSSRRGLALANGVGLIDSDYRGEIKVALVNLSSESAEILPGDRIAQLALIPVAQAELEFVEELGETGRGTGGFGSTGYR